MPRRSALPDPAPSEAAPSSGVTFESPGSVSTCDREHWDGLNSSDSPFLSWAYLAGLEQQGLVGPASGWRSAPLIALRAGRPVAAMPAYVKDHSLGEFVFDWAWAEACLQAGIPYYPKLVVAVPYTPVPGARVLAESTKHVARFAPALLDHLRQRLEEEGQSSLHVLFPGAHDAEILQKEGLMPRLDCRFLWRNQGFADFEDFLATFTARQRKNIRRERRKVTAAGVRFSWHSGAALSEIDWDSVQALCASTFYRHGHRPYLNAGFFRYFASQRPGQLLVCCGHRGSHLVAASIYFRDKTTLYGRYWGSREAIDCLHFEACYYQGIEYAIEQQLACFDPGTQGEHKLRRGFAPVASTSAHWFRDAGLQAAVSQWLCRERRLVRQYISERRAHMPFREASEGGV